MQRKHIQQAIVLPHWGGWGWTCHRNSNNSNSNESESGHGMKWTSLVTTSRVLIVSSPGDCDCLKGEWMDGWIEKRRGRKEGRTRAIATASPIPHHQHNKHIFVSGTATGKYWPTHHWTNNFCGHSQVRLWLGDGESALGGARSAEPVEHSDDLSASMGRLARAKSGQSHPGQVQGELREWLRRNEGYWRSSNDANWLDWVWFTNRVTRGMKFC